MVRTEDTEKQLLGAAITIVGVSVSVVGLNFMKLFATSPYPWKMDRHHLFRWAAAFVGWGGGQVIMLFGVQFALQSVCSAVANLSLIVNGYVAHRLFGEPFTVKPPPCEHLSPCAWLLNWDLLAIAIIIGGASSVVLSSPTLPDSGYTVDQEISLLKQPLFVVVAIGTVGWMFLMIAVSCCKSGIRGVALGCFAGTAAANCYTCTTLGFLVAYKDGSWSSLYFYGYWVAAGFCKTLTLEPDIHTCRSPKPKPVSMSQSISLALTVCLALSLSLSPSTSTGTSTSASLNLSVSVSLSVSQSYAQV